MPGLVAGVVLTVLAAGNTVALPAALTAAPPAPGLLDFSAEERSRIAAHGPWPPQRIRDRSNAVEHKTAVIELGRRLFNDRDLSAGAAMSCADCHVPARAFQDGLTRARGRGEGRRNTPGLLDSAQRRWLGWDGAHDSLWAASLAPMIDASEMARPLAELAQHVRHHPRLRAAYRRVFGQAPGSDDERVVADLAKALAAFQATLVSARTPFDDFRDALARGDAAAAARLPLDAQRGLKLFVGLGRCTTCHTGPGFTNDEFANVGMPHFVAGGIDPGRFGGLQRLQLSPFNRLGRHNAAGPGDPQAVTTRHVAQGHRQFGEFRVPSLRQLAHTAPYMHDGSLATLDAVAQHYSQLNEERLHADGERILRRLDLSAQQASDLVAFLRSLSSAVPLAAPRRAAPAGPRVSGSR